MTVFIDSQMETYLFPLSARVKSSKILVQLLDELRGALLLAAVEQK